MKGERSEVRGQRVDLSFRFTISSFPIFLFSSPLSRHFAFFAGQNVLADPVLRFPIFFFPKFHLFRPLP